MVDQECELQQQIRKLKIKQKAEEVRKMIREGVPLPEINRSSSKAERRTRPISPKAHYNLKTSQENRRLARSMSMEPGYLEELANMGSP